jgi:Fic family protein
MREPDLKLGHDLVKLIAEIDEFKGRWEAFKTLSADRLRALRKVATIESVGSSTRIEGAKLSDAQVETLLSDIAFKSFKSRDEQEVAGYAEAMDLVFEAFDYLRLTENHVRQLHQTSAIVAPIRHSPTTSLRSMATGARSASCLKRRRLLILRVKWKTSSRGRAKR